MELSLLAGYKDIERRRDGEREREREREKEREGGRERERERERERRRGVSVVQYLLTDLTLVPAALTCGL